MFKSPLVVGYKGEIGSYILNGLLKTMPKALNIWCFDINESEKEKIERIKKSDVIFLCIPMQCTIDWLLKYKKQLKNKIIIEQTSVKGWLDTKSFKKEFKNLNIFSMHLLFRPSATFDKKDKICFLINDNRFFKEVMSINTMCEFIGKITDCTFSWFRSYKEHDMLMARNQALVHKTILILHKMLGSVDIGSTYISRRIIELAKRIEQGDKTLYTLIQSNEFMKDASIAFEKEWKKFDIRDYDFDKKT